MEGTSQSVQVSTTPPGAICTVDREGDKLGQIASTPGSLRVDKSKNDLTVTCSKPGYQTSAVSESPRFVGTTFGNLVIGGGIGAIVDAASGANYEYGNQISFTLAPLTGAVPVPGNIPMALLRSPSAGPIPRAAPYYEPAVKVSVY